MEHNHFFRTGQAASFLGVNPRTIRRWVALRQIRFITTPGGERRIPASEIERILRPHIDVTEDP